MLKATQENPAHNNYRFVARPSWYTENLGTKSFLDAMTNNKFREQYTDALSCYLRDQEVAGLDVVTDGDCRFDQDVAVRPGQVIRRAT